MHCLLHRPKPYFHACRLEICAKVLLCLQVGNNEDKNGKTQCPTNMRTLSRWDKLLLHVII